MEGTKTESVSNNGEISAKELVSKIHSWYRYLLGKKVLILFFCFVGAIIGVSYAFYKKPVYTASTTFVIEDDSSRGGGLGQYSGLASMVGIDIGGSGGGVGGIFQGDNLIELYKSRAMIVKALLSKVVINNKEDFLVNRYLKFHPVKQFKGILFNDSTYISPKNNALNRAQDSLLTKISQDINNNYLTVLKPDKKLSIIRVTVKSEDEIFSKIFTDKIVEDVNDFYVKTKTKKAVQNLAILQHQVDSIRHELNSALFGMASSTDANPNANPSRQILRVPSQKRQVDVEANKAILTEIVKSLELSKLSLRKETPLFQTIDEPVFPIEKYKPSKLISMLLGGFIFGFLSIIILTFRKIFESILK